ncbi:MAG: MFS transporter [Hyphomicrobium sp.]|nr:MFS transporter [Hyphomicrobium sp.]PPD06131.1 MAG: MFS transporter [Hyphomicrobium sp.]
MTDKPTPITHRLPDPGADYGQRIALYFAAMFVIYGVLIPFLPVWLDGRGLDANEVAIVMAVPFILRLAVTPTVAIFADRLGAHRLFIIASAWAALAASLALGGMTGFWPILLIAAPLSLAAATMMPLVEAIAVKGVRLYALDYGRMRLWGSLSFVVVGLIVGALIDRSGSEAALWVMIAGTFLTVAAAHALPHAPAAPIDTAAASTPPRSVTREVLRLLRMPVFLAFLIAASAVQASHAMFYTFGALHMRDQGISGAWVGALWAIGVLAEVALFAVAGSRFRHLKPDTLLAIGAAAAILRWAVMTLDPPLALLVPLQLLHALTYGATHLGAILFVARAVPDDVSGTVQALYATFASGVAMGIATWASGPLFNAYKGGAYASMAGLAAASLAAALVIRARWNQGTL